MRSIKTSAIIIITLFFLVHCIELTAQAGITWTSRSSAADNNWVSVTFGNGTFVAVADNSVTNPVMTSTDGITWTSRDLGSTNSFSSVTFGNNLFVAVGSGTNEVMTSPDGITWTARTAAASLSWRSVTFGNGLFVAVAGSGTGNRVMTSPDGITWTSRTSAVDNTWFSVAYGGGMFVAVSNNGSGNQVMSSPDGITWTSRSEASTLSWQTVTWGNGLFVAVGVSNGVMTSPDGITWTNRTPAAVTGLRGVTYGNGIYVVVSGSGGPSADRVMTSPDGITWTSRTQSANNFWKSVTYGNGMFVAVSNSGTGNRVMTSGPDVTPVTWQRLEGILNSTNHAQLTWRVSEYNVLQYAVEKSLDGFRYTQLQVIPGKGDGDNIYRVTDSETINSTAWYRIRQVDNDLTYSYSPVIKVQYSGRVAIRSYPSPVAHILRVEIPPALLNKKARLINMQGAAIIITRLTDLVTEMDISAQPPGHYVLIIENEKPLQVVKQ